MKIADLRKLQHDQSYERYTESVLAMLIILLLILVAAREYDVGLTRATLSEFFTLVPGPQLNDMEYFAVEGEWPAEKANNYNNEFQGEDATPETTASLIQNVVASGSLSTGPSAPSKAGDRTLLKDEELRYVIRDGAINFAVNYRSGDPGKMWILGVQPAINSEQPAGSVYWVCGYGAVPPGRVAYGENFTNVPANSLFTVCLH